ALTADLMRRVSSPKYAGVLEYGADYGSAYLLRRGLFLPWELGEVLSHDVIEEGLHELSARSRLADSIAGIGTAHLRVSALEASCVKLLVLVTDAFGGRGGIAKFNRDMLHAVTGHARCTQVVALPRVIHDRVERLPPRLVYDAGAARGKASFVRSLVAHASAQ